MSCGQNQWVIQCLSEEGGSCQKAQFTIQSTSGEKRNVEQPAEILKEGYSAVSMSCATKGEQNYVITQYGELPAGCSFCEFYYLYTSDGRALTHSNPLVLVDKTLPPAQQQFPNNTEFDTLFKKLGLKSFQRGEPVRVQSK
jgi:hypothetical protein